MLKTFSLSCLLLAAALATGGCEMQYQDDHSSVTVQDGTVSSFETRQDGYTISAPASTNTTILH